ncbi:hypothetical protein GCM10011586_28440 [Silvibacterium dinghuense]|nr:hypothetical protein GCM10011586_28440 [Silvibacterium dinghuense]
MGSPPLRLSLFTAAQQNASICRGRGLGRIFARAAGCDLSISPEGVEYGEIASAVFYQGKRDGTSEDSTVSGEML